MPPARSSEDHDARGHIMLNYRLKPNGKPQPPLEFASDFEEDQCCARVSRSGSMVPVNSLSVKTSLVQSNLPTRRGGSPRYATHRAQPRSADPRAIRAAPVRGSTV